MGKIGEDPLERERRFRQSIEHSAAARRRGSRPVRGCLGTLAGVLIQRWWLALTLIVLLAFGGFFLFIFGLHLKWTEAYACSLAQARRSTTVRAEIGEPVEPGFFAWSFSYFQGGSVVDTSYRTTLQGPKGKGTLYVRWYSAPVGSSLQMELHKDGKIHPVYSGAAQCP